MNQKDLFPNIPSPEHTKRLRLTSDAIYYLKKYGSKELAIQALQDKCNTCSVDDCDCEFPEIITVINSLL